MERCAGIMNKHIGYQLEWEEIRSCEIVQAKIIRDSISQRGNNDFRKPDNDIDYNQVLSDGRHSSTAEKIPLNHGAKIAKKTAFQRRDAEKWGLR